MIDGTTGTLIGIGGIAVALIGFIRFFLVRQIRDLTVRVDSLEDKYDLERGLKHKAYNDVARTKMALDLVRRLAEECSCGVLSPLDEVIGRLMDELETMPSHHIEPAA